MHHRAVRAPRFPRAGAAFAVATVLLLRSAAVPARAELPPLIPRAALIGEPERDWPQIAPDGRRLAYLAPSKDGNMNVWVRTVGAQDDSMVTSSEHGGVGFFSWAWDAHHLLYLEDHQGDENLHLWAFNLDTKVSRDLTPFVGVRATNLLTSPARPGEVLVGLNKRDPRLFDMYRIDLQTGSVALDTENPGDVLGWTTDNQFQIRAACALRETDIATVIRVRDGNQAPWRDVVVSPFEDTPLLGQANGSTLVSGFAPDGRSFYMATFRGSDTMRLVQIDASTGKELATVAHHPRCDIWMAFGGDRTLHLQTLQSPVNGALQAVAFNELQIEWQAIDPAVTADLEALAKALPGLGFAVTSRDRDDRTWIVESSSPQQPGRYHLYRRDTRRLELLFEVWPEATAFGLAAMQPVRFKARDGLSIPAYLTLPRGTDGKNLPLILLVHGGPWHRDVWDYDPEVQLLANRGYAVLQVQFRGSTGFGKKHLNAGNGEWGRAMQNDLTDAVGWAVGRKIADPKRVAIMGGSYGGYATLAGLAFTPDLYVCGVDVVGPSNVATTLASIPSYWKPVKKRWIRRAGDAENDSVLNARISPLYHAGAIRAPLLIGHGAHDPRVKQAESDAIVKALRERNLPVTYIVYPDEGHGFGRQENNLDFFGRVEEFLAKYLGGRAEPWVKVEGSSAEVR